MNIPTIAELESVQEKLMSILSLLPTEIRQGIDTSGKAEKYTKPNKKVKFSEKVAGSSDMKMDTKSSSNKEEIKAKFQAKLLELQSQRGGEKKAEKKELKSKKTKNKPAKTSEAATKQQKTEAAKPAPVLELASKLILSNLSLEEQDNTKRPTAQKKKPSDPKQLLQQAIKRKEKQETKRAAHADPESFDTQQAIRNALSKARGEKQTDDPRLLKAAIKRKDSQKKKSKNEWGKRLKQVAKFKVEKQKKRADNIAARKSKNKKKK